MRLSGSILASMLLVSATLVAQHTSGTVSSASFSGSSSSGASHSYSGGTSSSSSSANSHSSSNYAPHVSATNATQSSSKSAIVSPSQENANREKNRSLWHPFRKPVEAAQFNRIARCMKEPCPVCPLGESRSAGACVVTANVCPAGWNSFTCGSQYQLFNNCSALANQLKAEEQHMRGVETGPDLIHQMLLNQYQQCLSRFGVASSRSYLFDDTRLADVMH